MQAARPVREAARGNGTDGNTVTAPRADLRLYAYGCEDITDEDFVDVYPLLPGHIDLILQITSALRTRSSRSQGDDQVYAVEPGSGTTIIACEKSGRPVISSRSASIST